MRLDLYGAFLDSSWYAKHYLTNFKEAALFFFFLGEMILL